MIIRQFNWVHIMVYLVTAGLTVLVSFLFKNKSQKAKDILVYALGIFNILFFFVYKLMLYLDPSYDTFNIWMELPLHLCNINLFIIPLGVLLDSKFLKSFGFYVAPFAALIALTTPSPLFINYPIFSPRCIGYYGTHMVIVLQGIILCTLGYIKPSYKAMPGLFIFIVVLSLTIFGVNKLLYLTTGVTTNYFYTVHDNGIGPLQLLWKLIPVQYIYLLPGFVIYAVYAFLLTLPFELVEKNKQNKNEAIN